METRKELIEAVGGRYRAAPKGDKARILDEFCKLTGYHRKHAIRALNVPALRQGPTVKPQCNRIYDEAVRQLLVMLWEAGDRVCGKRLKALIPILLEAMERHGHIAVDPTVKVMLHQVIAFLLNEAGKALSHHSRFSHAERS